jgi:hypothetical protein
MPLTPRRVACSLCALFFVLLVAGAAPSAAEWRRLDSPNFIVIGDVGANTLRDIAFKFEGFRETLGRVLNPQVTATAVPTVVIVFPNERAFRPFMPKYEGKTVEVGGLFARNQDVNYIALASTGGDEALAVVFHEYAHLIMSNVARNLPAWLGEGLAEYYSTYEMTSGGKQAKLGLAVQSHLLELRNTTMLPLEQLLNVTRESSLYNEGNRRSVFYAQSWALTHMLLLGEPSRAAHLVEYLSKLGAGVPHLDAWKQVFDSKAIEEALQRYVRLGGFYYREYKFSEKLAALEVKAQPLAVDDADAFLSDFLLLQRREAEARKRLGKVLAQGGGSAWSATVAALLDVSSKDYPAAEKRLLALGGDVDWFAGYRAGAAIAEIVEERREAPKIEQTQAARRLFAAAHKAGHDVPNATGRLAAIELAADDPPPAALRTAIERARLMAPGRLDYVFLHARVLAKQGAFPEARATLGYMMLPAYPQNIRDAARSLMGYIVELERFRNEQAARAARRSPGARADLVEERPSAPAGSEPEPQEKHHPAAAGVFVPSFRPVGAGEQRIEGALEAIDCAGGVAVFMVRGNDGVVKFPAPRLDTVDFITYRDDLKGSVRCGPLKEAPRVYVTFTGATADTRRVVAIEFLPK